jgi:copper chaperone CopZ
LSSLSPADNEFVAKMSAAPEEKMAEKPEAGAGEKPALPEGEVTVTLSGVGLFCRDCVERVEGLKENEEFKIDPAVELTASRSDQTVTIKAPSAKVAQAAVRTLLSAGYYGTSDVPGIEMAPLKEDDFTSDTMVVRDAAVVCSGGVKAFEKAAESVDGVDKVDAKAGSTRIKIDGEGFKTYEVMKALREAGFGGRFQ